MHLLHSQPRSGAFQLAELPAFAGKPGQRRPARRFRNGEVELHTDLEVACGAGATISVCASKARRDGEALAAELARNLASSACLVRTGSATVARLYRGVATSSEEAGAPAQAYAVMHTAVELTRAAPSGEGRENLVARLNFEAGHLNEVARRRGLAGPAARLHIAEVLKALSLACKNTFVMARRPVGLTLEVQFSLACPGLLRQALQAALSAEEWRLGNWRLSDSGPRATLANVGGSFRAQRAAVR